MTKKEKDEWTNIWNKNEEKLRNMLVFHNVPEDEARKIINKFKSGLDSGEAYTMVRCIDHALRWHSSHLSYDFYYFLQMRFAYYMCSHAPEKDKKDAVKYLRDLTQGYLNYPSWKDEYNNIEDAKKNSEKCDLIMPENIYKIRKEFFKKKYTILAKKFGNLK